MPSMRKNVRASTPGLAPGRWAAPVTSKGLVMARAMASTARASSRPSMARVSARSGIGSTLKLTSVSTPRVPWLPAISLTRS